MLSLASAYNKSVQEESTLSTQELKTRHVGKQDPKRHLEDAVENAMGDQVSTAGQGARRQKAIGQIILMRRDARLCNLWVSCCIY